MSNKWNRVYYPKISEFDDGSLSNKRLETTSMLCAEMCCTCSAACKKRTLNYFSCATAGNMICLLIEQSSVRFCFTCS